MHSAKAFVFMSLALTALFCVLVGSLVYDRDLPAQDERAAACHHALYSQLCAVGFYPYRMSIDEMSHPLPCHDDSGALLQALKQLLDPQDILAPGRYDFRCDWRTEE